MQSPPRDDRECTPRGLCERLRNVFASVPYVRARRTVVRVSARTLRTCVGACMRARIRADGGRNAAVTAPNFELTPATNFEIYSTTATPVPRAAKELQRRSIYIRCAPYARTYVSTRARVCACARRRVYMYTSVRKQTRSQRLVRVVYLSWRDIYASGSRGNTARLSAEPFAYINRIPLGKSQRKSYIARRSNARRRIRGRKAGV